jgi:hypothetical protein
MVSAKKRLFSSLIVILLISQYSLSAKTLYSHQQASQILGQQKIENELSALKDLKSSDLQLKKVETWLSDSTLELLYKEKLLYETTLIFRNKSQDPANIKLMGKLNEYKSQAFLPLTDGGHRIEIAAFQVAASAKATLIHWQMEEISVEASALIKSDARFFLQQISELSNDKIGLIAYNQAINKAPLGQVNPIVDLIKRENTTLPSSAMMTLAKKTGDRDIFEKMIKQYASDKDIQSKLINALETLPETMVEEDKIALLVLAASKQSIASAATLALSPYVDNYMDVQDFLFDRLTDPASGGAAAKALGSSKDLLTLEKLSRNLTGNNQLLIRRSLLALYLNNSYQAKRVLLDFKNATSDQQLKREVGQWLR